MAHIKIFEEFNTPDYDKKTIDIEVSSNLFEIFDTSILDPAVLLYDYDYQYDMDDEEEDAEAHHEELVEKFDSKKYNNMILNHAQKWIDTELFPELKNEFEGLNSIKAVDISRVRSSMTVQDEIDYIINIDIEYFTKAILKLLDSQDFIDYLKTEYASRSGFMSFMPSDSGEVIEVLSETDYENMWKIFTIVINFKLKKIISDTELLFNYIHDNENSLSIYDFQKD
jgi:hypothetical protein